MEQIVQADPTIMKKILKLSDVQINQKLQLNRPGKISHNEKIELWDVKISFRLHKLHLYWWQYEVHMYLTQSWWQIDLGDIFGMLLLGAILVPDVSDSLFDYVPSFSNER